MMQRLLWRFWNSDYFIIVPGVVLTLTLLTLLMLSRMGAL